MDRRQLKPAYTVSASTILEVVISMVIIVIVFGIALMIFVNVTRSSVSVKKIHAEAILNEELHQTEQAINNKNFNITVDDVLIEQEILPYGNNANLSEIHLTAYDVNQNKIAELKKIVYWDAQTK